MGTRDHGLFVLGESGWNHLAQAEGLPGGRVNSLALYQEQLLVAADNRPPAPRRRPPRGGAARRSSFGHRRADRRAAFFLRATRRPAGRCGWSAATGSAGPAARSRTSRCSAAASSSTGRPGPAPSRCAADRLDGLFIRPCGGLFAFHPGSGAGRFHLISGEEAIQSLLVDREGILWVATRSDLIKLASRRFATWTQADGLVRRRRHRDPRAARRHPGFRPSRRPLGIRRPPADQPAAAPAWRPTEGRSGCARSPKTRPATCGWRSTPPASCGSPARGCRPTAKAKGSTAPSPRWRSPPTARSGSAPTTAPSAPKAGPKASASSAKARSCASAGSSRRATARSTWPPPKASTKAGRAPGAAGPAGSTSPAAACSRCSSRAAAASWWAPTPASTPPTRLPTSGNASGKMIALDKPKIELPVFWLLESSGLFWAGTGDGVFRFDLEPPHPLHHPPRHRRPRGPPRRRRARPPGLDLDRHRPRRPRLRPALRAAGAGGAARRAGSRSKAATSFPAARRKPRLFRRRQQRPGLPLPRVVADRRKPTQIRYRLARLDQDWRTLPTPLLQEARYYDLPPQAYIFELQAASADEVWGEVQRSVPLTIAAPFFRQPWFFGLLALLALGGVFVSQSFVAQRRYSRRLEREVEKRVVELRAWRTATARPSAASTTAS